jgi:phosphoinositide-3-kinase regulatory subunit 4
MTALDAARRPSFDAILQSSRGTIFPESFYSFLHNYISSVNEISAPSPFSRANDDNYRKSNLLPSDSDRRLERLWSEFDSVESYLFLLPEESDSGESIPDAPLTQYGMHEGNGTPFQAWELIYCLQIVLYIL